MMTERTKTRLRTHQPAGRPAGIPSNIPQTARPPTIWQEFVTQTDSRFGRPPSHPLATGVAVRSDPLEQLI